MLSEFLIEVKLNEEQDNITQTVTGARGAKTKPTAYDKVQKGKGKGTEEKGVRRTGVSQAVTIGSQMDAA